MESVALLVAAALNAGTPLLLAAIGLLVNERSGVLNLGAEGMMLLAAAIGFATGLHSGSLTLGLLAGTLAGIGAAALFGLLAVGLAVDQYAAGLGVMLAGTGLSALIGLPLLGRPLGIEPVAA